MACKFFLDVDSEQTGIFSDPKRIAILFQKTLEAIAPETYENDWRFKADVICLQNSQQPHKYHFISNVGAEFGSDLWNECWKYLGDTLAKSGLQFDLACSKKGQLRFEPFLF